MEYEHPLVLTTPHMRGVPVRDAQFLLAGHNVYSGDAHPIRPYKGAIDSEYGLQTAAAAHLAKYWLGYPAQSVDRRFGQEIYELLTGKEKLPDSYKARRLDRIKRAEILVGYKVKALKLAQSEIGTKESPFGSNRQKYGEWYGMNGVPWCAISISYWLSHAGHPWKYSYVPSIADDATHVRNHMTLTRNPEPGDLVCYTFHGTPNAHVAFFHSWTDQSHSSFYDLGGNTGPINMSNGGEVAKQIRYPYQVTHFVRLL